MNKRQVDRIVQRVTRALSGRSGLGRNRGLKQWSSLPRGVVQDAKRTLPRLLARGRRVRTNTVFRLERKRVYTPRNYRKPAAAVDIIQETDDGDKYRCTYFWDADKLEWDYDLVKLLRLPRDYHKPGIEM